MQASVVQNGAGRLWCRANGHGVQASVVQCIGAASGALPCLNFRAWCSCWHPHGACTADRSSYAACAASRLQGHPRRHFYSVLHTASFGRMAAQAGWEAGAVLFISCVFSH